MASGLTTSGQTADRVLDCGSTEAALSSLGALFDMPVPELRRRIKTLCVDWEHWSIAPENQVVLAMGIQNDADLPQPSGIRWFHATRAPKGTTFEEGLLPTLQVWPKLWERVGQVASQWVSPDQWIEYRHSFEKGDRHFSAQFYNKEMCEEWEGPFAFLVRDAALGRVGDHKDFTKMSEALEDVCADFEDVFKYPLAAAYRAATSACLVSFVAPGPNSRAMRAALNYVHREVCGFTHSFACNENFVGAGKAIPAEWIDRIEWLEDGDGQ